MSYLIHFNKNHSAKNGQFVSGDGDGDGIVDDHGNRLNGRKKNPEKILTRIRYGAQVNLSKKGSERAGTSYTRRSASNVLKTVGSNMSNRLSNNRSINSDRIGDNKRASNYASSGSSYVSSLRDIDIRKFTEDEENKNRNPGMYYGPADPNHVSNPEEQRQHEDEKRRGITNAKSYSDYKKQKKV